MKQSSNCFFSSESIQPASFVNASWASTVFSHPDDIYNSIDWDCP